MDMNITLGDVLIIVGIIIWDVVRSFLIVHWTSKKIKKDLEDK